MKTEIPTLEQLQNSDFEQNELTKLLESDPPGEWLKIHPLAKNQKNGNPVVYLPIERIDFLLRSIFPSHWWEVLQVCPSNNAERVSGRLFYVNPLTGKVQHSDGVGACPVAVGYEQALPIAESNAKKSAAKKLGKIFGRDLSRDFGEVESEENNEEKPKAEPIEQNPVIERIIKQIQRTKSKEVFQNINKNIQQLFQIDGVRN